MAHCNVHVHLQDYHIVNQQVAPVLCTASCKILVENFYFKSAYEMKIKFVLFERTLKLTKKINLQLFQTCISLSSWDI